METQALLAKAIQGDMTATESLLGEVKDKVYNMSLKMLFLPQDAEDATQEILIKVYRGLPTFKGNSQFMTWVYTIARNHLINERKRNEKLPMLTFEMMQADGLSHIDFNHNNQTEQVEDNILTAELKVSCTLTMLQCLEREQRLMFILSEVVGLNSNECGEVFEVSPATFRKRMSRIRDKMREGIKGFCGLAEDLALCKCNERLLYAVQMGRVNKERQMFVHSEAEAEKVLTFRDNVEELNRIGSLYKHHPSFKLKKSIINQVMMSH